MKSELRKRLAKVGGFVSLLAVYIAVPAASAQRFTDWGPPENLGPVVNSTFNDQHPAISKNGLSLYFTSNRPGGSGGLDIWVSQREDRESPWGVPQNLGPLINASGNDLAPAFSPDGHHLYFHSTRPGGCGGQDLYVSYRRHKNDDFAWEPPMNLGCVVNSPFDDAGPTIFVDDETETTYLYFTRNPFTIGNVPNLPDGYDIMVSILGEDGQFGPAALVEELYSPFRDTRTAISRNGLEMILSSGRPGGLGSEDLWVSTRESTEDPWGTPVNLGPLVNTPSFEGAPALSRDGTTLYFFSEKPGGLGQRDLYVSTRSRIRGHRESND